MLNNVIADNSTRDTKKVKVKEHVERNIHIYIT